MRLLNTFPWQDVGEGGRWANSINNFSVIKIQKKKMIMKIWGKEKNIIYSYIYVYQITSTTEKEVMQYKGGKKEVHDIFHRKSIQLNIAHDSLHQLVTYHISDNFPAVYKFFCYIYLSKYRWRMEDRRMAHNVTYILGLILSSMEPIG